ncbi:697_t:CDS:1, partial [Dentiscutata heterogama]
FDHITKPETFTDNPETEYRPRYICSECFILHGGHFYERYGRGHEAFTCKNMHSNDINEALQVLGYWILYMTGTTDEDKKKILLAYLVSVLQTFF